MKFFLIWVFLFASYTNIDAKCKDRKDDCAKLSIMCEDPEFDTYVKFFCRKTCGFCSVDVAPAAPLPPHQGGCGQPDIQGVRVIAGKTPVRGSWPWQILLTFLGKPTCGGAIVDPYWIVTAAHCVYGEEQYVDAFTVTVGEHDTKVEEGSEEDHEVEKIIMHSGYDKKYLNNDIAMLKLTEPIQFNKYVSPICLPSKDPDVGSKCYITGWGAIQYPGSMTHLLQQGELSVVANPDCFKYNKKTIAVLVTKTMLCAGNGGTSPLAGCHGDSGGPFVCESNGKWELQGSVSYGSPDCKSEEAYTVFARTTFFKPWILEQMNIN